MWGQIAQTASSAGGSIVGGVSGYLTARRDAKTVRETAAWNAAQLRMKADQMRIEARPRQKEIRKGQKRRKAQMRGMLAKRGLVMTGSPVEVMAAQAEADQKNLFEANRGIVMAGNQIEQEAQNTIIAGENISSALKAQATASLWQGWFGVSNGQAGNSAASVAGIFDAAGNKNTGGGNNGSGGTYYDTPQQKNIDQSNYEAWV